MISVALIYPVAISIFIVPKGIEKLIKMIGTESEEQKNHSR